MKANSSISKRDATCEPITSFKGQGDGQGDINTLVDTEAQAHTGQETIHLDMRETELQADARRHGLTVKELASLMGVNYSHLCSVANGRRRWTPDLRERAMMVLSEVPARGSSTDKAASSTVRAPASGSGPERRV